MKKNMLILLLSLGQLANAATSLFLPISGDSHKTIAQLNENLAKQNVRDRLPEIVEIKSTMSQKEVGELLGYLSDLADKASKYQGIDTSGAYGQKIEGKNPCFKGDINGLAGIYENMIDSFVSDQFSILAVSTSRINNFGIKYDQTDSGSEGSWINISRCR